MREVLVIDNHSATDAIGILRARLRRFPTVRILETSNNLGFGKGYGVGIAQATGDCTLIVNPDKHLEPPALRLLVRALEEDAALGIVAPKLLHADGSVRHSARTFPTPLDGIIKRTALQRYCGARLRRYLQSDAPPDEPRDTDWVVGGCLLIRTDLLRRLQGFDPRFFLFFEDIDLCRRVWHAGFRVRYVPAAVARDRKQRLSDMPVLAMPWRTTGRAHLVSAIRYFRKWGTAAPQL